MFEPVTTTSSIVTPGFAADGVCSWASTAKIGKDAPQIRAIPNRILLASFITKRSRTCFSRFLDVAQTTFRWATRFSLESYRDFVGSSGGKSFKSSDDVAR